MLVEQNMCNEGMEKICGVGVLPFHQLFKTLPHIAVLIRDNTK